MLRTAKNQYERIEQVKKYIDGPDLLVGMGAWAYGRMGVWALKCWSWRKLSASGDPGNPDGVGTCR